MAPLRVEKRVYLKGVFLEGYLGDKLNHHLDLKHKPIVLVIHGKTTPFQSGGF